METRVVYSFSYLALIFLTSVLLITILNSSYHFAIAFKPPNLPLTSTLESTEPQSEQSLNQSSSSITEDIQSSNFPSIVSSENTLDLLFKNYESEKLGFHIQYPSKWKVKDEYDEVTFISRDKPVAIGIFSPRDTNNEFDKLNKIFNHIKLAELLSKEGIETLKEKIYDKGGDFELIDTESHTSSINGKTIGIATNTIKIVPSKNKDVIITKLMTTVIADPNGIYVIFYSAKTESDYKRFLPVIQKMINSFQID